MALQLARPVPTPGRSNKSLEATRLSLVPASSLRLKCKHQQQRLSASSHQGSSYPSLTQVTLASGQAPPPSLSSIDGIDRNKRLEERIERAIFDCRFLTLLAVVGSLAGSLLCFVKGSLFVLRSFSEYFTSAWNGVDTEVILLLVEAVDIYLMGTVMLIFGMGLYELFVSTLEIPEENQQTSSSSSRSTICGSNLFGLFRLQERPKWLEIRSLDELKTKLGHVIVMILLVGMFEKSKKIVITTGFDLVCLSASILFSSGCLFLLSKLHQN